jgi:TRAP-type C4-dicarboxylate transport system permease small subunit
MDSLLSAAADVVQVFGSNLDTFSKWLSDLIEETGQAVYHEKFKSGWKATRAFVLIIPAVALTLYLSWLGTRKRWPRKMLDGLYFISGIIAAVAMLTMLGVICAQMYARWTAQTFPGATAYAGYCMAAASFFALAYALNTGSHIRVNLMLTALGKRRHYGELWCFAIAAILATYFARYAVKFNFLSEKLGEKSQDLDKTDMWIPQLSMSIGTVILAICLWDNLMRMIVEGRSNFKEETVEDSMYAEA